MESSTAKYYSRLDHLRFLAALMVLAWHSVHYQDITPYSHVPRFWPLSLLEEGHTGVALFMTLSGFIFYALCRGREIHYFEFLRNRVLRIAPLFIVWTLFLFYRNPTDSTKLAVAIFTLINPDIVPGVGWTIIVEFQFYVVFPFLMYFVSRNGLPHLAGLIVLAILLRGGAWYIEGSVQKLAYWTIFGRIDQFLMGMLGCELFFRYPRQLGRWTVLAASLMGLVILFHRFNILGGFYNAPSYPSPSVIWIFLPTLEGGLYALMAAAYLALDARIPRFLDRGLARLGTLSYSFYLNHFVIIGICWKICSELGWKISGFREGLLFCFFLVLPVVTAVSTLTYTYIEKPFLSLRRRYLGAQRSIGPDRVDPPAR